MIVIAIMCFCLFIGSFLLTREHVKVKGGAGLGNDFKHLLKNAPWWIITAGALCTNLFNTVRGATVAYYFKYYIGENAHISLGTLEFLFFAGLFLAVGEVCNMVGVVSAVPLSKRFGKKTTFIVSALAMAVLSVLFFYVPVSNGGFMTMLLLQILISLFTGIVSPLVWSMYADVADYSTVQNGTSSTALIFSSGSMAQKFGGAIAGSAVLLLFDAFGLVPNAASQTDTALLGMRLTMSYIPAAIAIIMALVIWIYPLTTSRMQAITNELKEIEHID